MMLEPVMSEQSLMELSLRQKFMERAQDEMTTFERREIEFRKKDREQRAAQLRMPLDIDLH